MASYKQHWVKEYQKCISDWPRLVEAPLFPDQRWKNGGPRKAETEIYAALILEFGDAPPELVRAFIHRARRYVEEVDRLDLLNTDDRHVGSSASRASYLHSKIILILLGGAEPSSSEWRDLGEQYFGWYEGAGAGYEDIKFRGVVCLLLAREYESARKVMDQTRRARGYEAERDVLRILACTLEEAGAPVRDHQVEDMSMDFFQKIRQPHSPKGYERSLVEKFEWALLVAAVIDPGDGRLDAKRAIDMVSS